MRTEGGIRPECSDGVVTRDDLIDAIGHGLQRRAVLGAKSVLVIPTLKRAADVAVAEHGFDRARRAAALSCHRRGASTQSLQTPGRQRLVSGSGHPILKPREPVAGIADAAEGAADEDRIAVLHDAGPLEPGQAERVQKDDRLLRQRNDEVDM